MARDISKSEFMLQFLSLFIPPQRLKKPSTLFNQNDFELPVPVEFKNYKE
jgi:hypothetical protein